ncbi:MAG: hypothetical protein IID55_08675 [Proteobacteria bacterium]|nr:hypothetical protein [Pseudomonadota bacterium]
MTTETVGQGGTEGRQGISTMVVGRVIGWLFLAAALAALGWDLADAIGGGGWQSTALGLRWFQNHAPSLGLFQVIFQRFIPAVGPWLWDPVIQTVLLWPAWAVFGAPGILLSFFFRRRRGRRWFAH